MTIKREKWDEDRPAAIQGRHQLAKPFLFSASSIFVIVWFACVPVDGFIAWAWLDPIRWPGPDPSAVTLACAVFIHAANSAFLLLIKLWYVSLPIIWLNALEISKRLDAKSERHRKQNAVIA